MSPPERGGRRFDVGRFVHRLADRRAAFVFVAVGVALCFPALGNGLILDDHLHRLMSTGGGGVDSLARSPFDLFRFLLDDPTWRAEADARGFLPWYASPHLHAAFLRPLPSAMLWAEYRYGLPRPLAHLHDLVWYAVALGAVWHLFRVLLARHAPASRLPAAAVAGFAGLAFALDEAHGLAVGWTANRHAAMCTAFAALALASHVRWRADGDRRAAVGSLLLLVLGLLCGELTLSITAYLFAYALVLDSGPFGKRMLTLVPALLVSLVWLATYSALGYGTGGSSLYTDPIGEPGAFLVVLPVRFMLLMAGQWTPIEAETTASLPATVAPAVTSMQVLIVVPIALALRRRLAGDRLAVFFAVGMVIGALPACAVFASDRNLFIVGIGGFGLLATWWAGVRAPTDEARPSTRFERAVLAVLLVFHFVLAPLSKPLRALSPAVLGAMNEAHATTLVDALAEAECETVVAVTTTDFFSGPVAVGAVLRSLGHRDDLDLRTLHTGIGPIRVERPSDGVLEIDAPEGFQNAPFDRLLRPDASTFEVGDAFEIGGWAVRVMDVDEHGAATRVRFAAPVSLDAPVYCWVALGPDGYEPFSLPATDDGVDLVAPRRKEIGQFAFEHLQWPRPSPPLR